MQSQHQICFGLVCPLYILKISFIITLYQKDLNTDAKEKVFHKRHVKKPKPNLTYVFSLFYSTFLYLVTYITRYFRRLLIKLNTQRIKYKGTSVVVLQQNFQIL